MRAGAPRRGAGHATGTLVVALGILVALVFTLSPSSAQATPAAVNGSGSSYVALAMQQWVADGQTAGLKINYLPTGSPQGLTAFGQNLIDFAGTEAEFSALQTGTEPSRGYQYVPDVAGAVSVMYNVADTSGRKVDYLHLSRRTIARIFTGDICSWSDPAIKAENKSPGLPDGLVLPDKQINVVYRGGQSGTTALFYDFVAHVAPDIFGPWAAKNQLPTNVRIIQLDSSPGFACKTQAFQGSDQIAQYIGSAGGAWSIGYDEFGFAKTYKVPAAWVQNQSGAYQQPYSPNISAALEGATLRPDLSQELSGVYASTNPIAYPISAYSYMVTQCAVSADRPTCKGSYSNPGVTETLSKWMRYIACEGQKDMASIGYSPLPPNLSQEVANSIGRMTASPPEKLTATNCPNPRFTGNLGETAPSDPLVTAKAAPGAGGGGGAKASSGGSTAASGGPATGPATDSAAAAVVGLKKSAGGGSGNWRDAAPVLYDRPSQSSSNTLPFLLLLGVFLIPPVVVGRRRRRSS
ncbi:MAG TPA: substrate-binding domain-containing protein [Acidimicrobiales bacterium]